MTPTSDPLRRWRPAALAALGIRPAVAVALAFNGGAAVASFLSTVLLARLGGAALVGHYALALSTGTIIAVVALMGLERTTLRAVAGDLREGLSGQARAMIGQARRAVGWTSGVLALVYLGASCVPALFAGVDVDPAAMRAGALAILTVAALRLGLAALRGGGHALAAQICEGLPTYGFALLMAAIALGSGQVPPAPVVVLLFVGLQAAAAAIAWTMVSRQSRGWGPPTGGVRLPILRSGLPFMAVILIHSFSDWALLATLAGHASAAEAGAFRVVMQVIGIPVLAIATLETYYSPQFAGDFRAGRPDLAWRRRRKPNRLLLLLMVPLLLMLLLFAEPFLVRLFGPPFAAGAGALRIMAATQILGVGVSLVGGMLAMAGHERVQLALAVAALITLVVSGLVLVPKLGVTGAGIAWSSAMVIRGGGSYLAARRLLGARPAP